MRIFHFYSLFFLIFRIQDLFCFAFTNKPASQSLNHRQIRFIEIHIMIIPGKRIFHSKAHNHIKIIYLEKKYFVVIIISHLLLLSSFFLLLLLFLFCFVLCSSTNEMMEPKQHTTESNPNEIQDDILYMCI